MKTLKLTLIPILIVIALSIIGGIPQAHAQLRPGNLLVIDSNALALFSVNPTNGKRTIISDFSNSSQGPTGVFPDGVAVVPSIINRLVTFNPIPQTFKIVSASGCPRS